MSFYQVFDFLRDLNKNNHKAWMDEHRATYHEVRDFVIDWTEQLNRELQQVDADFTPTPGKKALSRINNNLVYQPNLPTYRDYFGIGVDQGKGKSSFYLNLGLSDSFIGGGFYRPSGAVLNSIRQAIDYNGDQLKEILREPSFQKLFGDLSREEALKTAPQGFSSDHAHIDLLRLKSYAAMHSVTQKDITDASFISHVVDAYQALLPLRRYLEKAASV
jgi:uncharacterized protein (TIGR02453 family)